MNWPAVLAGAGFLGAMVFLSVWTKTRRELYDNLANWSFLLLFASLLVLIVQVHQRLLPASPLIWVFTVIGLLGDLASLLGQVQVMFGGTPFERVAMRQTIAFGGILVWIAGVSWIVVRGSDLPVGLGWLGLGAVLVGVAIIALMTRDPALLRGERAPRPAELGVAVLPFLAIAGWLFWLGAAW